MDAEHADRDSADRRQPSQPHPFPCKMILPSVTAGVEERCDLSGFLVESSYVRTFITITP